MWRPAAIHSAKRSPRPQGQYHGKQKIFCQVVDEVQAVCELEVEYFIPGFCFYMECPVKNEQQQGVGDGHRYQK